MISTSFNSFMAFCHNRPYSVIGMPLLRWRCVVEKKLYKGMTVEIDTKKEETWLTNPERQMKHENRLSLFLTDSHGKIKDFQKIEEELGSTLVRGKAYNSATWPFSNFPEKI